MFDTSQTLGLPFEKTEFDPAKNFVELLRFPVFIPNKVGYKLLTAKWIETRNPSQLLRNEKKTFLGTLCPGVVHLSIVVSGSCRINGNIPPNVPM